MRDLHGEGWVEAPPGVLDRLTARLQGRRRANRLTNTFAAVISSLVLAGVLGLAGVLASRALGYTAILPGFVTAHTHLDLSGLSNRVVPGPDFVAWLRAVVQFRRGRSPEEVQNDIRLGIADCLAHGTTLVGDISASGASWRPL